MIHSTSEMQLSQAGKEDEVMAGRVDEATDAGKLDLSAEGTENCRKVMSYVLEAVQVQVCSLY